MANLTEEEKEILFRAHEIRERLRAEELEAGEISLEEAEKQAREELRNAFGPPSDAGSAARMEKEEAGAKAPEGKRQKNRAGRRKGQEGRGTAPKKKRRWVKRLFVFLLVLVIVLAVLMAVAYAGIRFFIAATNYQPYERTYVRSENAVSDRMVTNILLIGTDNRVADDASRSDAMILVSVNRKKARLVMTSILRDSYVNIPGYGMNRINHSYQMGGAPLLIQTIEENFGIGVDYYVQVDFYDFIDVIDAFGGVEIDVTPEEFNYVNGYVQEINNYEGLPEGYSFLNGPGLQTLNGRQALGYSRIRYIGTDFARTGRQRAVLDALFKKVRSNPLRLITAGRRILPDLTTDIDDGEMTKLLMGVPLYLFYEVSQQRVPFDGTWWNDYMGDQEVLGIDFNSNNALLRSAIYD